MRRGRWTGLGIAVLCTLGAATPAQAAFDRTPIELGPGDGGSPSVAMDPAGTAHVAWGVAEDLIRYCPVPRGTRACAGGVTLSLDARASRPFILRRPQDGVLVIVAGRDDLADDPDESTWAWTSLDGATWSGPTPVAIGVGDGIEDVVLTADGQGVELLDAASRANDFVRAPLAGPPPASVIDLAAAPGATVSYSTEGDLLRLRDGRTMALLGSIAEGFAYRLLTGADPFVDASWTPPRRVTTEDELPAGAAGPRGAFVMYGRHVLDQIHGAPPVVVRRFRGTRWGRPRGVFYEVDSNLRSRALEQDARGRLHAAIVGMDRDGDRRCIVYARTRKGRWFSRGVTVFQALRDTDRPDRIRLAVDDRGRGVVAWATDAGAARLQRLKAGGGVTRNRGYFRRGCPPFPR